MALFSVYYDEKNTETKNLIVSHYKNHMFVYDGYCLLEAPNVTAGNVAKHLKIWDEETEESSYGVVLKLNGSYAGFADGEIWNWLSNNVDY